MRQQERRDAFCPDADDRRRTYLAAVVRVASALGNLDRAGPRLGMSNEDLLDHGKRLWLRARAQGIRTPRELCAFVAPGEDPAYLLADHDQAATALHPPGSDPTLRAKPTPAATGAAPVGGPVADDALAMECPWCGRVVRVRLKELVERRDVVCPAGHRMPIHACFGLAEVAAFLLDLAEHAERCLTRRDDDIGASANTSSRGETAALDDEAEGGMRGDRDDSRLPPDRA